MKKMMLALAAMAFALTTLAVCIDPVEDSETWEDPETGITWTYTVSGGGASVGGSSSRAVPSSTTGTITIPSTLGGCPVRSIGSSAFENCSGLTSVTISSGVTSIGASAFCGCSGLTSVTIPSSVTSIGYHAFYGCSGLTSMTIPSSVTSIGRDAFEGCSGLGEGVVVCDGWVLCVNGDCPTTVTIPTGTKGIAGSAFYECSGLTSVTIPSSVTSIGDWAFYECSGLTSVTIPEGVTCIGEGAFAYCRGLTSVTFKGNAPVCGDDVFRGTPSGLKIYAGTDSEGWTQWNGRTLKFVDMGGEESGGGGSTSTQSATLTVTNVVIHYVVNSIVPERASPLSPDTGFVNVITEVKSGGAVSVPESWAATYTDYAAKFGTDFVKSLMKATGKRDGAGNAMLVWQDYVAGTDPTDEEDVFKASVTLVDGKVTVSYTPELSEAETAKRLYKTFGKKKLTDENWVEVPAGSEDVYNFFKVTVEMR